MLRDAELDHRDRRLVEARELAVRHHLVEPRREGLRDRKDVRGERHAFALRGGRSLRVLAPSGLEARRARAGRLPALVAAASVKHREPADVIMTAGSARVDVAARMRALDAQIDELVASAPGEAHAPRRRAIHRVLACVGETTTPNVLSWTREIAKLFSADITLMHVTRPLAAPVYPLAGPLGFGAVAPVPVPDPIASREAGERILHEAKGKLERDVPEVGVLHREGHPGDEIVRAARELASDLVILGHHEGGALDRLLVGSTTDHVKNHTNADVLIARAPATPGPLLVGVDGSAASRQAAHLADEIARRWSTTVHLLHVVPPRRQPDAPSRSASALEGVELDVGAGEPRAVLRAAARGMGASLIALGARGTSGLRSIMPGSVSNALAHDSPASVLLVRDEESR